MRKQKKPIFVLTIFVFMALTLFVHGMSFAGRLEPTPDAVDGSGNPVPTMKTLDEVLPAWSQMLPANDGPNGDSCNSSRFKCVLNGEAILDKETGLVWQRTLDTATRDWLGAQWKCNTSNTGNRLGWRLPTVQEFASILDRTQGYPALPNGHPFVLPSQSESLYSWTATTYPWYTGWAYCASTFGGITGCEPTFDHYVWCATTTALTSKIWLIHADASGEWRAKAVADIGDPSQVPLPVDISISADDRLLWVDTFMDGKTRLFDVSDPHAPKQIYEKVIGKQLNMVSQSWDGRRVYFTSSLLANWDKKGGENEQFLKAFAWDGKQLVSRFEIDFTQQKLGRPHQMRFGAYELYGQREGIGSEALAARD